MQLLFPRRYVGVDLLIRRIAHFLFHAVAVQRGNQTQYLGKEERNATGQHG